MTANSFGFCCICNARVEDEAIVHNSKETIKVLWPVEYEGIWCRPCYEAIDVKDGLKLEKPKGIIGFFRR